MGRETDGTLARRKGKDYAFVAGYLVLWAGSLVVLHAQRSVSLGEPLLVFGIVGIFFSLLAWLVTRRAAPLESSVRRPGQECLLLTAYLLIVIGVLTWGFNGIRALLRGEPWQSAGLLATKLCVFVAVPLLLFSVFWKYRLGELITVSWTARRHLRAALAMSLVLVAFQIVFGRGVLEIRRSGLPLWVLAAGIPFAYLWLIIEVGLVEEFFFRALLQARFAALFQSETAGMVLMALLFGLAHAPGFYFRTGATLEPLGQSPSWLTATGYSIAVTSVTAFFLGVLWIRTRNVLILALVHAAGDLVPNLVHFLRVW